MARLDQVNDVPSGARKVLRKRTLPPSTPIDIPVNLREGHVGPDLLPFLPDVAELDAFVPVLEQDRNKAGRKQAVLGHAVRFLRLLGFVELEHELDRVRGIALSSNTILEGQVLVSPLERLEIAGPVAGRGRVACASFCPLIAIGVDQAGLRQVGPPYIVASGCYVNVQHGARVRSGAAALFPKKRCSPGMPVSVRHPRQVRSKVPGMVRGVIPQTMIVPEIPQKGDMSPPSGLVERRVPLPLSLRKIHIRLRRQPSRSLHQLAPVAALGDSPEGAYAKPMYSAAVERVGLCGVDAMLLHEPPGHRQVVLPHGELERRHVMLGPGVRVGPELHQALRRLQAPVATGVVQRCPAPGLARRGDVYRECTGADEKVDGPQPIAPAGPVERRAAAAAPRLTQGGGGRVTQDPQVPLRRGR